jgi:hypothetical protein
MKTTSFDCFNQCAGKMQAKKVTAVPSMISGFAKHPGVTSSEADYAVLLDADASSYMIFSSSPVSIDNLRKRYVLKFAKYIPATLGTVYWLSCGI